MSKYTISTTSTRPRQVGQKSPFKLQEIWAIRTRLQLASKTRDLALLFPTGADRKRHLSTRQYARLVKAWASMIGLDPTKYGTHSLRRTKPTLIYRNTKNLRAVQLLLGQTKLESTVRYLGVELEDALALSEQTEI